MTRDSSFPDASLGWTSAQSYCLRNVYVNNHAGRDRTRTNEAGILLMIKGILIYLGQALKPIERLGANLTFMKEGGCNLEFGQLRWVWKYGITVVRS